MPGRLSGCRGWSFALSAAGLAGACAAFGFHPVFRHEAPARIAAFAALLPLGLAVVLLWPRTATGRSASLGVLALAAITRLSLLDFPAGDDINRYLWEGKLVRAGESPYALVADAPERAAWRDRHWTGMNHRDLRTIYPPIAQWLFAGVGAVWYHPLALKLVFVASDLGAIALLMRLLARRQLPVRLAGLYAFNPVPLTGIAAEGHFDAVLVFCLVAALWWQETRRWSWAWVALGMAIQIKLVAVLLVPLFLRDGGWRRAAWGVAVVALPWAPWLDDVPAWLAGVREFGAGMAFNGFAPPWLVSLAGGRETAAGLAGTMLAGWTLLTAWRQRDTPRAAFWILGGLVLLSPTVHYWYLAWPLALLPLFPSPAWLVLSGCMGWYFLAWGRAMAGGEWALPGWSWQIIWGPFALLGLRELIAAARAVVAGAPPAGAGEARDFAVVVPALNEAVHLPACLASLRRMDPAPAAVIVADGGSTDATREIAFGAGAVVVEAPRGRGRQIAAGVARVRAEAALVLHADSTVASDAGGRLLAALNGNPAAAGGCVGQRFDAGSPPLLLIEVLNEIRALFLGASFGDQGQFFRHASLPALGGFPALPLMEDVEFSRRLRRAGQVLYLGGGVICSARRWRRDGWLRRLRLVLKLMAEYRLHRGDSEACAEALYRRYYPDPQPARPPAASPAARQSSTPYSIERPGGSSRQVPNHRSHQEKREP